MKLANDARTFTPLPDRTHVLDVVRPGLFRKDAENVTVVDDFDVSYTSLSDAIDAARQVARPRTADIAVIGNGSTFGLQNLVESYGPGPGGPFDNAFVLKLQDRDYFRFVHPDLQAVVGVGRLVTRDELVARLVDDA